MTPYQVWKRTKDDVDEWYPAVLAMLSGATEAAGSGSPLEPTYRGRSLGPFGVGACYKAVMRTNLQMLLSCVASFEALCKDWADLLQQQGASFPRTCRKRKGCPPEPSYSAATADACSTESYFAFVLEERWRPVPPLADYPPLPEYWCLRNLWLHNAGRLDQEFSTKAPAVVAGLLSHKEADGIPDSLPDRDHAWVHCVLLGQALESVGGFVDWVAERLPLQFHALTP